jgi:chromosome partitioning protein
LITIVIASQKGGVGKTTLTGHLAVEAERQGVGRVAMIDTDPQANLTGWFGVREAETPTLARLLPSGIRATLDALKAAGIDMVFVDTPPAITETIAAAIAEADIVVIPTKPSPHDIRAIGATAELVERARRPMVFVVNQAIPRSKLKNDAIKALSQHGTLAAVEIDPDSAATGEITALWAYLAKRLEWVKRS